MQKPDSSELMRQLVLTYDTKILDDPNLSRDLINALYKEAEATFIESERPILFKLIKNHKNKQDQTPTPDFIAGPHTLSCHWGEKYNKMIYIFGENHLEEMDCDKLKKESAGTVKLFEDFLFDFLQHTDKFIDFFCEIGPMKPKQRSYRSSFTGISNSRTLTKLFEKFKNCVETDYRYLSTCTFSRMHYFDIRLTDEEHSYNLDGMSFVRYILVLHETALKIITDQYNNDLTHYTGELSLQKYNAHHRLLMDQTYKAIMDVMIKTPEPSMDVDSPSSHTSLLDLSGSPSPSSSPPPISPSLFPSSSPPISPSLFPSSSPPISPSLFPSSSPPISPSFFHSSSPPISPSFFHSSPPISTLPPDPGVQVYDTDIENYLNQLYKDIQHQPNKETIAKEYLDMLNIFLHGNDENVIHFWMTLIISNYYVNKEFQNLQLTDKEIAKQIEFFFTGLIHETVSSQFLTIKENVTIIYSPPDIDTFVNSIKQVSFFCQKLLCNICDIYNMCRVFKSFNIENPDKLPHVLATVSDQPKKAHNIIIYAGEYHCNIYRNFLEFIGGFNKISDVKKQADAKACIDIRSFPKPFFSYSTIYPKQLNKGPKPVSLSPIAKKLTSTSIVKNSGDGGSPKQMKYNRRSPS